MTHSEHLLQSHILSYINLDGDRFSQFLPFFKIRDFNKGDLLIKAGDKTSLLYFVIEGCLKNYEEIENGRERTLLFAVQNWWIGDLYSWFSDSQSLTHIKALTSGSCYSLEKVDQDLLFAREPKFERYFRILVERAYVASQKRVLAATSKPTEERYSNFQAKYPGLEQQISQKEIASYLGITPEGLSRTRKKIALGHKNS